MVEPGFSEISFRVLLQEWSRRRDAALDEFRERVAGYLAVTLVVGVPLYCILSGSSLSLVEASEAAEPTVRLEEFERPRSDLAAAPSWLGAAQIRAIQTRLKLMGFNPGPVDGIAGRRTLSALNAYRQSVDLPTVREFNSGTVAALRD